MEILRLLHLSDLHFQSLDYPYCIYDKVDNLIHKGLKSYNPNKVNELVYWLYRNRDAYDVILISGDLAHTGHIDDLNMAYSFIRAPSASQSRPWRSVNGDLTLSGLKCDVILLPGNHDRFKQDNMRYPGEDTFNYIFNEYWSKERKVRAKNGFIKLKNSTSGLGLICADFTLLDRNDAKPSVTEKYFLPFNYSYLGQGRVTPEILDELQSVTDLFRRKHPGIPVIWAIHFSFNSDKTLRLIDQELLLDAAEELKVPVILSGHTHELEDKSIAGYNLRNITAGSATSNCGWLERVTNSFQLIDLEVSGDQIMDIDITHINWKNYDSFQPRYIKNE